ncbi:hypothetical protein [Flaviaesturariibacter terrae]
MYSISVWARGHKAAARILLFVALAALNGTAWIAGNWLAAAGAEAPGELLFPVALLSALLLLAYPAGRATYRVRKRFDSALMGCTCLLVLLLSAGPEEGPLPLAATAAQAASVSASVSAPPKSRKLLRRLARRLRAHYRSSNDNGKAALIVLTIVLGLLLAVLVVALACNVACSGAELLAIIVGLLGLAGIVFGVMAVIRRIVNGPRKKPAPAPSPAGG